MTNTNATINLKASAELEQHEEFEFTTGSTFTADGTVYTGRVYVDKTTSRPRRRRDNTGIVCWKTIDIWTQLECPMNDDDEEGHHIIVVSRLTIRYLIDQDGRFMSTVIGGRQDCHAFITATIPLPAVKALVAKMDDDFTIDFDRENIRTIFSSSSGFIIDETDEDSKAVLNAAANCALADLIEAGYEVGNLRMRCDSLSASDIK